MWVCVYLNGPVSEVEGGESGPVASQRMRGSTAGISDGLKGSSKYHYLFLTVLDNVLAAGLLSPLVVAYWRGTWSLMDYYVFPNDNKLSAGISLAIGLLVIMVFTVTQKFYSKFLNPDRHRLCYYLASRLYTALFSFACVNSWRGAWLALDAYTPTDPGTVALVTVSALLVLLVSRTLRNISAPPFAIVTDRYEGYFEVPTLFKTSTDSLWLYLLDCAFSVCVIGTLVVFVWRGTWGLLDHYVYPDNPGLSALSSLALGYVIVGLTFLLQPPIKYLARTLSGVPRLLAVDLYLLFSFCGTVNVWRGVWSLLNVYFFPGNPVLSYGLSHAVPFLLLVLINSSNSILVRGVYVDGEESGSQCVDFPCYYLRLFFQAKRKKRLLREAGKRRQEGETLVQVIPVECDWKKSANNGPETNQLLGSP